MRKLLCSFVMHLGILPAKAQTNPQAGYVITNDNDTLRGTIDYRTDAKNARSCLFMADGETAYKEYLPGEIKGYRLSDIGACYVTRTFPIDGEQKTFFAEYLLEGGVSLYRHKESTVEFFYLVDADGKVATIRETGDVIHLRDDQITAQRIKLVEATQIFQKSQKTLKELWAMPQISAEQLLKLTKAYNKEFYAEAGETEFYQKDIKASDGLIARFRIEAGVGFSNMKFYPNSSYNKPIEVTSLVPIVGVGTDMILPRLSKKLLLQLMLYYSHNKGSREEIHYPYHRKWTFHDVCLQAGVAYSFMPEKRISPLLRAGVSLDYLLGLETENMDGYHNTDKVSLNKSFSPRYYVGLGVESKLGTHKVSLTANYVMRNFGSIGLQAPMFNIMAGFVL
ncbi:MAG: hypothetical protein IKZ93_03020 [Prevotella sp.]|nr:hypothetical protein [Prevotella sp.]